MNIFFPKYSNIHLNIRIFFVGIGPLGRCFLQVDLSICVSVCLFTFEVLSRFLFAPTSRNRMSKIFRDLEALGKNNGKKWSQI